MDNVAQQDKSSPLDPAYADHIAQLGDVELDAARAHIDADARPVHQAANVERISLIDAEIAKRDAARKGSMSDKKLDLNEDGEALATVANMEHYSAQEHDGRLIVWSPTTSEQFSANPADYFAAEPGEPLVDGEGDDMVLAYVIPESVRPVRVITVEDDGDDQGAGDTRPPSAVEIDRNVLACLLRNYGTTEYVVGEYTERDESTNRETLASVNNLALQIESGAIADESISGCVSSAVTLLAR